MDKRISELNSASLVNTGDFLVMVQGTETLKVDVGTFLAKAPAPLLNQADSETVVSGALSKVIDTSLVSVPAAANVNYTLAAPVTADKGIVKTVLATAVTNTYTATLTVTGGVGFSTVTFNSAGDSVQLKVVGTSWYIVGSNGVVIA